MKTYYVIWSEEHGAWWLPAKMGYTRSLIQAGRYSESEAGKIVENANKYLEQKPDVFFNEVKFPDPLRPPEPTTEQIEAVAKSTNGEELRAALRGIDPRVLAECGIV